MPQAFQHPFFVAHWAAAVSATAVLFWLVLSNAYVQRLRSTWRTMMTLGLTTSGLAHSLVVVLIPFIEVEINLLHAGRILWITACANMGFWALLIAGEDSRKSHPLRWQSAGAFIVSGLLTLDLLSAFTTGYSVTFALGQRVEFATSVHLAPHIERLWGIQAAGFASTVLCLCGTVSAYRTLRRRETKDRILTVGVLISGVICIVQVLLAQTPYAMPLFFLANLLEAARLSSIELRDIALKVDDLHQENEEQNELLETQLRTLRVNTAMARIGEETAQISHDLRNPLTSAVTALQLLEHELDGLSTRPQVEELTDIAKTSMDHVLQLARKVTHRAGDMHRAPRKGYRLRTLIETSLQLCSHRLENVDVQLKVSSRLEVHGRKTHLLQLFVNLISNAADAMEELPRRRLRISATRVRHQIEIRLRDSGETPPAELRARMFRERFTTRLSGTGLGLTICAGIVREHNGTIRIDDKESRTTVVLRLPLARSAREARFQRITIPTDAKS